MSEEKKKMARLKVGGLWSKNVNGTDFLSGSANGVNFTIFPNGYKTEEKQPDYILYTNVPDEEGKIEKGSSAVLAVVDVKPPFKKD